MQDDFRRAVEPRIYAAGPDPAGCVPVHRSLSPSTACQPAWHSRISQDGNTTWKADLASVSMAGQHEVHTSGGCRLEPVRAVRQEHGRLSLRDPGQRSLQVIRSVVVRVIHAREPQPGSAAMHDLIFIQEHPDSQRLKAGHDLSRVEELCSSQATMRMRVRPSRLSRKALASQLSKSASLEKAAA